MIVARLQQIYLICMLVKKQDSAPSKRAASVILDLKTVEKDMNDMAGSVALVKQFCSESRCFSVCLCFLILS